jgi:predicted kinase
VEVVLFIGLQASGKSSFYRARFAHSHALVSKDLYPSARDKQKRQARELTAHLDAGGAVVVDNTHASCLERAAVLSLARTYGAPCVGYYFASQLADCLARNRARTGKGRVPDVALYAAAKRLELPHWREGFAALHYVRLTDDHAFSVAAWEQT